MILIGVKSKYGSCSGNCTGLININNTPPFIKKLIFFSYMYLKGLYSSKAERNTVNILVECSIHSKGLSKNLSFVTRVISININVYNMS